MRLVLENFEIRLRGAEMDIDRCCKRPHRIVGCNGYVMRFGDRRDPSHFGHSTDHADIRLNDIRTARGQERQEFKAIVERLSRCKRHRHLRFEFGPRGNVFRPDRLFIEKRVIRRDCGCQLHCLIRLVNLRMSIEGELEM